MKLYGISGLGADKRVFGHLTLDYELVPIEWIKPENNENIEAYALRLSEAIDQKEEFGILGVSFGGLVAAEISKLLNSKVTILVSSAETKFELPSVIRIIGRTRLLKILPTKLFDPPRNISQTLFGAQNKKLLNSILDDTDLHFSKWAVNELANWKNEQRLEQVIKIGGSKDKLIPPADIENTFIIEGGEHFMIVDRADEVSRIINAYLRASIK